MSADSPPPKKREAQPLLQTFLRAFATPQFLSALLVLVAAVLFLAYGPRGMRPERQVIDLGAPSSETSLRQVRLMLFDVSGSEQNESVSLSLPPGAGAQLSGTLAALREAMIATGVWPEELPAPQVFVETIERRAVAVIDLVVPEPVAVSVAQEHSLLRSLTATALANGVVDVRFLRNGRPQDTLLEHVAVPASL